MEFKYSQKITQTCLAVFVCSLCGSAMSQSLDQDTTYNMMRDFSRCSAMYEHFALIADAREMPANGEELRGLSRGAQLAASIAAMMLEVDVEDEDSPSQTAYNKRFAKRMDQAESYRSIEANRQMAFLERGESDEKLMEYCVSLNEVQVGFVELARKSGMLNE